MGCSASCSRLVGLAEIRTRRSSADTSSLRGTLELRKGGEPAAPLPQPPKDWPERGRSLNWGGTDGRWGLSLGGGLVQGPDLEGQQQPELNWDPSECWDLGCGDRHLLEGDSVLQPHFLVCQHGAVLIQD